MGRVAAHLEFSGGNEHHLAGGRRGCGAVRAGEVYPTGIRRLAGVALRRAKGLAAQGGRDR